MYVAVFAVLFGVVAHGAEHHSQHLTQIAQKVVRDMDTDGNGVLSFQEIGEALITHYDDNKDGCVTQDEFIRQWMREYHDTYTATRKFFNNLANGNRCLEMVDLTDKFSQMDGVDHDGTITVAEFEQFLYQVHPESHFYHGTVG